MLYKNIITLFFLSLFFTLNSIADSYDKKGNEAWKSKILSTTVNEACFNIIDFDNKLESAMRRMIIINDCFQDNTLVHLFADDDVSIYKLTVYKVLLETEKEIDTDDKKENDYLFFFFKKPLIYAYGVYIKIDRAIYPARFSTFYEVSICNIKENKIFTGMLPFITYNSLLIKTTSKFPLDCKVEQFDNRTSCICKLISIGPYVYRQTKLQSLMDHDHILNGKQPYAELGKTILPIPNGVFMNNIIKDMGKKYTLKTVLKHMHDLASAVTYLHENDIAHGDINIINLFMLDGRLVLSGFEYFSKFYKDSNKFGVKTFAYPAKMHYPYEFRNPFNSEECAYNHASFKDDVWSLGLVLAAILCTYYQGEASLDGLEIGDEIADYKYQQQIASLFLEPYRMIPMSPAQQVRKFVVGFFYYFMNKIMYLSTYNAVKGNNFNQTLDCLVEMINACHNKDRIARPKAKEIKAKLSILMGEN